MKGTSRCTAAERCSILAAWDIAKAYIIYTSTLKLQFTSVIPFLCAGMMHEDAEVGRSIAKLCISQFDGQPDVTAHHPCSVMILSKDHACRHEVDSICRGCEAKDLPEMMRHVGPLKFMPCCELPAEAAHNLLQMRRKSKHSSMSSISWNYRRGERQASIDSTNAFVRWRAPHRVANKCFNQT